MHLTVVYGSFLPHPVGLVTSQLTDMTISLPTVNPFPFHSDSHSDSGFEWMVHLALF